MNDLKILWDQFEVRLASVEKTVKEIHRLISKQNRYLTSEEIENFDKINIKDTAADTKTIHVES